MSVVLSVEDCNEATLQSLSNSPILSNVDRFLGFSVHPKKPVVLAIRSIDCWPLPSAVVWDTSEQLPRQLEFLVEEQLPLDAEDMIVSSLRSHRRMSGSSLIVVTRRQPILDAAILCEQNHHWIASVSSLALLAVDELILKLQISSFDCLMKSDTDGWDLVAVRDSVPVHWKWLGTNDIIPELHQVSSSSNENALLGAGLVTQLPIVMVSPSNIDGLMRELHQLSREIIVEDQQNQCQLASDFSDRIVRGTHIPMLDFRGDKLPTKEPFAPLRYSILAFLSLMVIAMTILHAGLWWKAIHLSKSASDSDIAQDVEFRKLYPGERVPTDVRGRLRSEWKKIKSSLEELQDAPPIESSLPPLVRLLNSLPRDEVFRIDTLQSKSTQITLVEGATRKLDGFEAIVQSIRKGGFEFQQPNVTTMADGFIIRIEKLTLKNPSMPLRVDPIPKTNSLNPNSTAQVQRP